MTSHRGETLDIVIKTEITADGPWWSATVYRSPPPDRGQIAWLSDVAPTACAVADQVNAHPASPAGFC